MRKIHKCIILIAAFAAIIIFPICVYVFVFPMSLHTEENLLSVIGLYIAYYTLCATIGIAFIIYWMQKRDVENTERLKIKQAKSQMLLELENYLEMYLFIPRDDRCESCCDGIKDVLNSNAGELRTALSAEEFHILVLFVNAVNNGDDNEIAKYIRPWLQLVYLSEYQKFFVYAHDFKELLNKSMFELINKLGDGTDGYKELSEITDGDGDVLFKETEESITITNSGTVYLKGKLGYNEIVDEPVIIDGYGKNTSYAGYYRNGFYEGEGTQFDENGRKLRSGQWQDGKLISGIEYNELIHITSGKMIFKPGPDGEYDVTEDFQYESLELYGEEYQYEPFQFSHMYIVQKGLADFYVVDMELTEAAQKPVNIRTLEAFLKKENPEYLEQLEIEIEDEKQPF